MKARTKPLFVEPGTAFRSRNHLNRQDGGKELNLPSTLVKTTEIAEFVNRFPKVEIRIDSDDVASAFVEGHRVNLTTRMVHYAVRDGILKLDRQTAVAKVYVKA